MREHFLKQHSPTMNKSQSDNPAAFKHLFNQALLERLATSLTQAYPKFPHRKLISITDQLQTLEMKARVTYITQTLYQLLPVDFESTCKIILSSSLDDSLRGFDLWPYTHYIQNYGLDHLEISLQALKTITPLFTAEFAIRPFLIHYQQHTLNFLEDCANSEDEHLRRFASEGSRPRLPWGERLPTFIADPTLTQTILQTLKFDESLYVRKSVANHLNDISKDHPAFVINMLTQWQQAVKNSQDKKNLDWITKHALRSLIKAGNSQALALIGIQTQAQINISDFRLRNTHIRLNEYLEFEFSLSSNTTEPQSILIDYVMHFLKSNQRTSPKVFKLKSFSLAPGECIRIQKKHLLKPVTTRQYYLGEQALAIQINGKVLHREVWHLEEAN
jgi:3-methyladenine DNA glycosylase AlkC